MLSSRAEEMSILPERSTTTVTINGTSVQIEADSVETLLEELGYSGARRGIAVALNGRVVPRSRWTDERPGDGDSIEIVGAVQGG